MLKNTYNYVLKGKYEWRVLNEVASICSIYLSCLKDSAPEILLLEETFNMSSNNI